MTTILPLLDGKQDTASIQKLVEELRLASLKLSGEERRLARELAERLAPQVSPPASRVQQSASLTGIGVLPAAASELELNESRYPSAVLRGNLAYLPLAPAAHFILPHVFARSALFSPSRTGKGANLPTDSTGRPLAGCELPWRKIRTPSSVQLTHRGDPLTCYDRRIYAAGLTLASARPLCADDPHARTDADWVQVSAYAFFQAMGCRYNPKLHGVLRQGLERLSQASIQVRYRAGGLVVELHQMLEVEFKGDPAHLKSSDLIWLRVPESTALLFGKGCWTSNHRDVFKFNGLQSWLAAFIATHTTSYPLSEAYLAELSGLDHYPPYHFTRCLYAALNKLKQASVPPRCRVLTYRKRKQDGKLEILKTTLAAPKRSSPPPAAAESVPSDIDEGI